VRLFGNRTMSRRAVLAALAAAPLAIACGAPAPAATPAPAKPADAAKPAAEPTKPAQPAAEAPKPAAAEPTKPAAAATAAPTAAAAKPAETAKPAAAAPAAAGAKPTLRLAHWWGDQYKTWIPMLKAKTGISIEEEISPWNQYYQKVMTQLVGGQATDLLLVDTFWYGDFFKSGALVELDDRLKDAQSAGKIDTKKFYYPQERECGYNGKTWALTIFLAQDAIVFLNKEMAEQAGVLNDAPLWGRANFDTWKLDKWLDMLKAGTKAKSDGTVDQYGLSGFGWGDTGRTLVYSAGGKLFDDDWEYKETKTLITEPPWVETLQWLVDLIHKHKVAPPPDVVIQGGAYRAKRAMSVATISTPSVTPPSLFPQEYMHIPVHTSKVKTVGGNAVGISKVSKYPDDAFEWIRVFLTDAELRESQRFQNAVPAYDPTPIVQAAKDGPEKTINLINLSRARGFSTIPPNTEGVIEMNRGTGRKANFVNTTLNQAFTAMLTGKVKVEDALKEAKAKIEDELPKP
jgi:ABC-type glycerol-3-phosphate transport system substrate-binding protein